MGWTGFSALQPRPGVRRPPRGPDPASFAVMLPDFFVPYGLRSAATRWW